MSAMSTDELREFAEHYYTRDLLSVASMLEDWLTWHSNETFQEHFDQLQDGLALAILVLKAKATK